MPKVTSFTCHRTWYFKFHKFPHTEPTLCLLLKADRTGPSGGPRGRPKHDPLHASGWHGHGWDPDYVVLRPGQIIVLWAVPLAHGLHAQLYCPPLSATATIYGSSKAGSDTPATSTMALPQAQRSCSVAPALSPSVQTTCSWRGRPARCATSSPTLDDGGHTSSNISQGYLCSPPQWQVHLWRWRHKRGWYVGPLSFSVWMSLSLGSIF
jgi:hypothetical protein